MILLIFALIFGAMLLACLPSSSRSSRTKIRSREEVNQMYAKHRDDAIATYSEQSRQEVGQLPLAEHKPLFDIYLVSFVTPECTRNSMYSQEMKFVHGHEPSEIEVTARLITLLVPNHWEFRITHYKFIRTEYEGDSPS